MDKIEAHFSKTVGDYDTVADSVVFKNDELHQELINLISLDKNKALNILDLGCGTGHGINLILKDYPNATITGIDFSPVMLDKIKLNKANPTKIKLINIDFREFDFIDKYDVIISAMAIHNINHDEKEILFKKLYLSLKNKGCFINADFYEHEFEEINNGLKKIYEAYLNKNLSGDELKVWLKHAFQEDMPMPLSTQSGLLKKIGFDKFELIWLFNNQAIYKTTK